MEILNVTCAVIFRDGMVLATQRSAKMPHPLKWEFPGGKVREGESLDACLVREIREELGTGLAVIRPMKVLEHTYPTHTVRLHPFLCRIHCENIRLSEHSQYRWVSCTSLGDVDWLDADLELVDRVRADICKSGGKGD